jgi:transposase
MCKLQCNYLGCRVRFTCLVTFIFWQRTYFLFVLLNVSAQLAQLIKTKNGLVRQLQPYKALMNLEGVAEVCASMLYSSIGDGKQFKSGREASDFIGLTPKQHSSGGKVFMTGIDRAGGIKELRSALYQGALS